MSYETIVDELITERDALQGENDRLRAELERVRTTAAKTLAELESGLRLIVAQPTIELALDPQWARRVASMTLTTAAQG